MKEKLNLIDKLLENCNVSLLSTECQEKIDGLFEDVLLSLITEVTNTFEEIQGQDEECDDEYFDFFDLFEFDDDYDDEDDDMETDFVIQDFIEVIDWLETDELEKLAEYITCKLKCEIMKEYLLDM